MEVITNNNNCTAHNNCTILLYVIRSNSLKACRIGLAFLILY